MSRYTLLIPGVILSMSSSTIVAHHSRAEFVGDVIELEGELVEVDWVNPHPKLMLRASDSTADVWEIQAFGSVTTLRRAGIEASFFPVGERITVAGLASRRRENFLLGSHALLPSGLETVLQYNAGPHWSGEHIGGSGGDVIDESALARAAAEDRGIFRVWSLPATETASAAAGSLLAEVTETARAEFLKVLDISADRCEEPPMPWAMITPVMREFIDNGDRLTLRSGYAGGSRTIHLRGFSRSIAETSSDMGRSLGRWEGNTLVVETDLIESPTLSLQSPEMKTTERFTLSDDQSRLDYLLVIDDSIAFGETATFRLQYLALGEELLPQCAAP
jgi:hypothetical protein